MRARGFRNLALAAILASLCVEPAVPEAAYASDQLYAQSAEALLQKHFLAAEVNYLLLDPRSGNLLASRWPQMERAVPIGSLMKPFTAVAYARSHRQFPQFFCHGTSGACWLPRGHGQLDLPHALANSCNAYFRALAAEVQPPEEARALSSFGLPASTLTASDMAGLGDTFKARPLDLARGYAALAAQRENQSISPVILGMQMAAQIGTARIIGRTITTAPALAKTGTAPCIHGNGPGDGFAVVLYPADAPRLELLVRVHSAPGAHAASVAAMMLHALLEQN